MRRALRLSLILPALAACAEFPELDRRISPEARATRYPVLVPQEEITGRRGLVRLTGSDAVALEARAAALRARARILRGIPIDEGTRRRVAPRLNRLGG